MFDIKSVKHLQFIGVIQILMGIVMFIISLTSYEDETKLMTFAHTVPSDESKLEAKLKERSLFDFCQVTKIKISLAAKGNCLTYLFLHIALPTYMSCFL